MRIAITGASGGIARRLVEVLREQHEVVGIVRTPRPPADGVRYVGSSDEAALAEALAGADCVIHAALDKKVRRRDFLAVNRAMTERVLGLALAGNCRLFVYFSSQVVYSGGLPADSGAGYREEEQLILTRREDDYTRLKVEDERSVVAACTAAGVDWLVVRPTVVMGPGMPWSEDIVRAMRPLPLGIGGRTINLVHVDDLARQVEKLVAAGAANEAFNLGSVNVGSADFFAAAAGLVGRRARFLPDFLLRLARRALPSTFWFFATDVAIDVGKVASKTGLSPNRPLADYFVAPRREHRPETLEQLQALQRAPRSFKTSGRGYWRWFNPDTADDQVSMSRYRGVVRLGDGTVTVKSGTTFTELSAYLDAHDLCLATLPEFSGISVGAAFFVDVHGSSADYYSVYDLIESVSFLDESGEVVAMARDAPGWDELRRRDSRFILLELTLRTAPAGWLSNRLAWENDDALARYVAGAYRDDLSTTIQWYPRSSRMLVYHINRVEGRQARTRLSYMPFRGLPYPVQRFFIAIRQRGRAMQIDRTHAILSPWHSVPAEWFWRRFMRRKRGRWRDLELRLARQDAALVLEAARRMILSGEIDLPRGQGIGIRFSRRPEDGAEFVWIEFVSGKPEAVSAFIATARRMAKEGLHFHKGKYVPPE